MPNSKRGLPDLRVADLPTGGAVPTSGAIPPVYVERPDPATGLTGWAKIFVQIGAVGVLCLILVTELRENRADQRTRDERVSKHADEAVTKLATTNEDNTRRIESAIERSTRHKDARLDELIDLTRHGMGLPPKKDGAP